VIVPRRLPALKAQMIEDYESRVGRVYCEGFMQSVRQTKTAHGLPVVSAEQFYEMPQDGSDLGSRLALGMRVAENYHVSDDIVSFIETASLTLPADESFSNFDLPSTHGFIYLEKPLETRDVNTKRVTTRVIVWNVQTGEISEVEDGVPSNRDPGELIVSRLVHTRTNVPGVNISMYHLEMDKQDHDDFSEKSKEIGSSILGALWASSFIPFGEMSFREVVAVEGGFLPAHEVGIVTTEQWLRTFWKFVKDELPALDMRREDSPRSDRRWLRRMRLADNTTTIITLRKRMPGPEGHGGHEYSHRFVVRGHWAKRWCGPGRTELRYVYINPYLKGPEDAPLLAGREHVHHVSR
jgi:hypothetical protein